jgi:predicted permease
VWQDVRYALRGIRRSPGFALVAGLTLALGIGANCAIFSFLNELLLRPVPQTTDPGSLVQLRRRKPRENDTSGFTRRSYDHYAAQSRSFSGLLAYRDVGVHLGLGGRPESVGGQVVSANFFSLLGLQMRVGRPLGPADNHIEGGHPVAVISASLWERRFGADAAAVGRRITINRLAFTVVGVAPVGFRGIEVGSQTDVWIPLTMERPLHAGFDSEGFDILNLVARLKPAVALTQAQAEIDVLAAQIEEWPPAGRARVQVISGVRLIPEFREYAVGLLRVLVATSALVLLIACANIANLLLTRASGRRQEIAVRQALGGGRGRLVRQFLTESALLATGGGALGLVVAQVASRLMMRHFYAEFGAQAPLDGRVLMFTLAATAASSILFGLVPALQATRQDVVAGLKDMAGGRHRTRLRAALVAAQVALCLVAVVSAGLFVRTLRNLAHEDLGFQKQRLFFMQMNLRIAGYNEVRGRAFYNELLERVRALPLVKSATLADTLPPGWLWSGPVEIEGHPFDKGEPGPTASHNTVGAEFFQTLGIPVLLGRGFQASDSANATRVIVVNETLTRQFWPGESPIGKRLRWTNGFGDQPYMQVVGVVRDGKYGSLQGKTGPFLYVPFAQKFDPDMKVVVRSHGDVNAAIAAVRQQVQALDPELPVPNLDTMEQHISESLVNQRVVAITTTIFGLIALALAAVGLYGVVSWSVAQRTREIGIRLALGAEPRNIMRVILGDGLRLVAAGLIAGGLLALTVTRVFTDWLFGVNAADPASYATAAVLLTAVMLLAIWIPARRALSMNPARSLRAE